MADIEALTSMISGLESKSAYSRLKPLMPTIDRKIKDGVRRAEIHEMLIAHGIEISAGSFYTYLWRYRKKNFGTAKSEMDSSSVSSPAHEDGDVKVTQVDKDAGGTTAVCGRQALDLLSNSEARDKFTEQFFIKPSVRRKKT